MSTPQQLPIEAVRFRDAIIRALGRERFNYLDEDTFVGTCPICGEAVGVRFAGYAPRARLDCHSGCTEAEIASHLGLEVKS